jgi:hypothetical protein
MIMPIPSRLGPYIRLAAIPPLCPRRLLTRQALSEQHLRRHFLPAHGQTIPFAGAFPAFNAGSQTGGMAMLAWEREFVAHLSLLNGRSRVGPSVRESDSGKNLKSTIRNRCVTGGDKTSSVGKPSGSVPITFTTRRSSYLTVITGPSTSVNGKVDRFSGCLTGR